MVKRDLIQKKNERDLTRDYIKKIQDQVRIPWDYNAFI